MNESSQQEFAELFATCERDLHRYIGAMLRHRADALDVVQETATALWKKFESYDRSRPFDVWARQFAYVEVQRFRKRRRQQDWKSRELNDTAIERLADEHEKHRGVLELRSAALVECMKRLTELERALVRARYSSSGNLREIAAEQGVPDYHLYRQLQRIRLQLRKCVDQTIREEGR